MQMHLTHFPGQNAVGVVDFNTTGEAAMAITINSVKYAEADAAVPTSGVWTNGASAANSATSFAAAVNGDTREDKPKVTAVVSTVGDSVFLIADYPGTEYNYAVTTDSLSNCTVENMKSGLDPARKKIAAGSYVVSAQDVLADQVMIALPFAPSGFIVNCRTTAGVIDAVTVEATLATSPDRLKVNFAGATDPVAGDILHYVVFE